MAPVFERRFSPKEDNGAQARVTAEPGAAHPMGCLCYCFRCCSLHFHLVGHGAFFLVHSLSNACVTSQPWEPQCFCSNFPHEAVCAEPWGQALLVSTDAGVLLVDG